VVGEGKWETKKRISYLERENALSTLGVMALSVLMILATVAHTRGVILFFLSFQNETRYQSCYQN